MGDNHFALKEYNAGYGFIHGRSSISFPTRVFHESIKILHEHRIFRGLPGPVSHLPVPGITLAIQED